MKYLVTGASGFVGTHLTEYLTAHGHEVVGLVRRKGSTNGAELLADLTDSAATTSAIRSCEPDGIFHLAAPETSVGQSWKDPEGTKTGNLETTRALLEAASGLDPSPRVLLVSSSEVYGDVKPEEQPLNENSPERPDSPYAESKQAGERLAAQYAKRGLPVIVARPFHHIGQGQSDRFAIASFAKQIAKIEAGASGPLKHGNLEAKRDFTDVRDIVTGYALLMQKGELGETYNIGAGHARSVKELLDMLVAQSTAKIEVVVDEDRFRTNEVSIMECDASKIRQLGWEQQIPISQTVSDILADARLRTTK